MTDDMAITGALPPYRRSGSSARPGDEVRDHVLKDHVLEDHVLEDHVLEDHVVDDYVLDAQTQAALTACLFDPSSGEHIWWTVMVVDPALHETPSDLRLVGHYETELEAVDAAAQLAAELNRCLVPGEAPLTTRPLGIEPEVALSGTRPVATSSSPADRPRAR